MTVSIIALLLALTIVAANVMDLAHVLSMDDGTFSMALAFIFPTLVCFEQEARAPCGRSSKERQQKLASDKFDTTLGLIFMKISIIIGATCISIALHNAMAH
jgi:hypothetical protein